MIWAVFVQSETLTPVMSAIDMRPNPDLRSLELLEWFNDHDEALKYAKARALAYKEPVTIAEMSAKYEIVKVNGRKLT